MAESPIDYSKLENPYDHSLVRSSSPLSPSLDPATGDASSGSGFIPDSPIGAVTEQPGSSSSNSDLPLSNDRIWTSGWYKSRSYKPRENGFLLEAAQGFAEFSDLRVGRLGIKIYQTATGFNSSNAIYIENSADYPAIDIRKTKAGAGMYIQTSDGASYGLDLLQQSDTPALHAVSDNADNAFSVQAQLEQRTATNSNYYKHVNLRGGAAPAVSVKQWSGTASPDGILSGEKGDVLQGSTGVFYVNTDGATAWSAASMVDIQSFSSGGTWTKPVWAKAVHVIVTGGGGGGGGGHTGANTNGTGGAGGGGGNRVAKTFRASDLASTISVTIGSGGAGGSAGNPGSPGGFSSFSTVVAYGGGGGGPGAASGSENCGGGGAGTASVGADGTSGAAPSSPSMGGSPASTAGANGISGQGGGGTIATGTNNAESGGAGGAGTDNATLTPRAGGSSLFSAGGGGAGGGTSTFGGADGGRFGAYTAGGGGAGGAGGASPASGTAGANGDSTKCGYGGGGGGGTATNSVVGAVGGAGGTFGGGGGGGGASFNTTGGAGGVGGVGGVIVISW